MGEFILLVIVPFFFSIWGHFANHSKFPKSAISWASQGIAFFHYGNSIKIIVFNS